MTWVGRKGGSERDIGRIKESKDIVDMSNIISSMCDHRLLYLL